ncbi:DNA/RNA non-specific endonuclease [Alkanindiges sp. WGS2144]|uniref:DNA/RNA non-specific endonuclease n=1 Tax=Alkanindiges sp. WGS2144 TaxID=3366808 RepID=UPI003751F973
MAPQIQQAALKRHLYPLCFNGFAVMYSGVSRTPLWSAEYLTPQRLKQAKTISRQDNFHEENRVPEYYRSRLSDYSRSGYDRGHMAPNGDMASRAQQYDSFSLANMVPQSPRNNQEVWRNLEEATRTLVSKQKRVAYVITGPAFLSDELKQVGQVLVPTHVYKVVYFPELELAGAYFAPNDQSGQVDIMSVKALEEIIGITLFPRMPATIRNKRIMLPLNASQASKSSQSWGAGAGIDDKKKGTGYRQPATQHGGKTTEPAADWMEWIKQQLAEILVALLRSR